MEVACDICGCTRTNLVDGYYYCAECGTQDMHVRETVVEVVSLGDGVFTYGKRKTIRQLPQATEEMTNDWYKWHSMNFLLQGLASDLVELGAAPSFKTKLLWVWTRYMRKYQDKADFGLASDDLNENEENERKIDDDEQQDLADKENRALSENDFSMDEEEDPEHSSKNLPYVAADIKRINISLVISLLYVALNLDKSHIQLAQLIRFILEGRLPVFQWQKYVPKELRPKKLLCCLLMNKFSIKYSYSTILKLSLQLFRELDLGNPIVPDLRLLVDQYMKELCLPNDMKPLILSVMQYRSFDYLDMNVKFYEAGHVPSYELYVMSHILCALKMCFGLDGVYENKLSDAVENINEMEDHPKSYNSEPTGRLFSFREWCTFLQFRKCMLWRHSLYLGAPNYCDMDDFVAFEHLNDKPDFKKTLQDEIAIDIINKLPDVEINVIPKSEFPVTTSPHTTYTAVIKDHHQDPTVKQLLSEDFTQYSLKYITEDMFLVDPDSVNPKNIIAGVNEENMNETGKDFKQFEKNPRYYNKKMVYVKDCDNHNWMITQKPLLNISKNVSKEKESETDENENNPDSKDDSIVTDVVNDISSVTDSKETSVITEDSKMYLDSIIEIEKDKNKGNSESLGIPEEAENCNIFDDNFENLDTKKEKKEEEDKEPENTEPDEPVPDKPAFSEIFNTNDFFGNYSYNSYNQDYYTARDSDESSRDSIHFDADSLDRHKAIEELVIHACNKYQISIPGKYICAPRKKSIRKTVKFNNPERAKVKGLITQKIKGLIADYENHVQNDIFIKMSSMVQSAITDYNQSKDLETPMEIDELPMEDNVNIESPLPDESEQTHDNIQTLNDTTQVPDLDKTSNDDKYQLFGDDSDGETHAEELLPKKNPYFDEATHDITRLYIDPVDVEMVPEIKLDTNLYEIIDKEIKDEKEDKDPLGVKECSDSEEEMSLSMVKELKLLREQLTRQSQKIKNKQMKLLIKNPIPQYKYWVTHYLAQNPISYKNFATEIDRFPASFKIVINECADIVGYPAKDLYCSLQRVETCIKDKYVRKKKFVPSYFEKQKKSFMTSML